MRKLGYTGKLFREFVQFARQNKMYWIIPLVVILGLMAVIIVAANTAAPFIYTLF